MDHSPNHYVLHNSDIVKRQELVHDTLFGCNTPGGPAVTNAAMMCEQIGTDSTNPYAETTRFGMRYMLLQIAATNPVLFPMLSAPYKPATA